MGMSKMKEMPYYLRPREKAYQYGVGSLSNNELLAIVLGNGYKDNNVLSIANNLINDFDGLYHLSKANQRDLIRYKGLGKVKSINLLTIFELAKRINECSIYEERELNIEALVNKYRNKIAIRNQEYFAIIVLNKLGKIVYETILYMGESNKGNI